MKIRRIFALSLSSLAILAFAGWSRVKEDVVVLVAGSEVGKFLAGRDPDEPFAIALDASGDAWIAEYKGQKISKLGAEGKLVTVAGTGAKGFSGDGGPATSAQFRDIHNIVAAPNGDLYIADTGNNRVRKIEVGTGVIRTVLGTGKKGFGGDGGPALDATFGNIYSIAFDRDFKYLVLADLDNRRIRRWDILADRVSTIAGNGTKGVPEDGADARDAPLLDPRAVAVDGEGCVYVLERSGHVLRRIDAAGKIKTVAGTGKAGFSGDDGQAILAAMNGPKHLAIDPEGRVLIVDTENHAIRRYDPKSGTIVRIAGTGKPGHRGIGGPADRVELKRPHGVATDASGTIFIADSDNHRVLKIRSKTP